jgi:ABC-type transporter Mla subunit MlaD
MAEGDPFSQMFNLFAAPLAGTIQSFEQFRRGVDEFLRGVENFNRTMENMNEVSERINRLLSDVEEPLRAAVPQVVRTVKAADEMMKVVSGPAMAVAPGLKVLAEALNNPAIKQMPNQLSQMNDMLSEVTARLAPLGQLAESAGGLFGGFKLPGFGSPSRAAADPPATREPTPVKKPAARKQVAARKKAPQRKTAAPKLK